jgi:hypothetical protein
MSNHTPGPWHAATADEWRTASGEHAQWGRFDISAGSNDPAAEDYYRVASVSNVNNADQNQMNAKLIAAAPDLLAACKEAIDSGIGSHNHWDDTQQHGVGCPLCIRQRKAAAKLRAAIAKANGGET